MTKPRNGWEILGGMQPPPSMTDGIDFRSFEERILAAYREQPNPWGPEATRAQFELELFQHQRDVLAEMEKPYHTMRFVSESRYDMTPPKPVASMLGLNTLLNEMMDRASQAARNNDPSQPEKSE